MKYLCELPVITVSNQRNNYDGGFTPEEENLIKSWSHGYIINLFSGMCEIGDERVDLNPNSHATICENVFKYIENDHVADTFIIDPPYNERYAKKYAKLQNDKDEFVIFADTRRTTLLFDWIKSMNPVNIILKSFQFYQFADYKIKGVITYAGGYRRPIFLTCNYRDNTK